MMWARVVSRDAAPSPPPEEQEEQQREQEEEHQPAVARDDADADSGDDNADAGPSSSPNHTTEIDPDAPDDMTCAICLEQIAPADLAVVKGCRHEFCCHCILSWVASAADADDPSPAAQAARESCPCCKSRFSYLYTHRLLDGTLSDYPVEESVVLLLRSAWFAEHAREHAAALAESAAASTRAGRRAGASRGVGAGSSSSSHHHQPRDWADEYEAYLDAELEEDEELEGRYFSGPAARGPAAAAARRASAAAGGQALILGNRRWGEGGLVRAGRMYARPLPTPVRGAKGGGGGSKGKAAAAVAEACGGPADGKQHQQQQATPPGRRAKRAAKRAASGGQDMAALDAARGIAAVAAAADDDDDGGGGHDGAGPSSSSAAAVAPVAAA
jgi:hypothetical protein